MPKQIESQLSGNQNLTKNPLLIPQKNIQNFGKEASFNNQGGQLS